ncbi:MAG: tRNA-dihydrouridine synthase family protein [Clostridium sp.]|nr:tRNA-dihydrouridine synthase family protein [Clostridium sp.]
MMRLYYAPLEGITGYAYRNAHRALFVKPDRYYTPFITANHNMIMANREKRDIAPENNRGVPLVPQVLANRAEQFVWALGEMESRGYREVNLNLGCPSPTVVTRGRGSAMLADPDELDRFFEESFSLMERQGVSVQLSVKTRIGSADTSVAMDLSRVYNRYPFCEVIIHPRTRLQQYGGQPDLAVFGEMLAASVHPVCYNGNINTVEDYVRLREHFPEEKYPMLQAVMLGRGLLRDPMLAEKIAGLKDEEPAAGGANADAVPRYAADEREMLRKFHDTYLAGIRREIPEDNNVLMKMKEFWTYMGDRFGESEKLRKKIKKARAMAEYLGLAAQVFDGCPVIEAARGLEL